LTAHFFFDGLLINLIVLLLGVIAYAYLVIQMRRKYIEQKPLLSLMIVFATYGCLLLLMLSSYFWSWSGLSSLGTFYLIFFAPILMFIIAFKYRKKRTLSIYHQITFLLSIIYLTVLILLAVYYRIFQPDYFNGL